MSEINFILIDFQSRLEIYVDGHQLAGFSLTKNPQTHQELAETLKEIVCMLESPNVEDHDLI